MKRSLLSIVAVLSIVASAVPAGAAGEENAGKNAAVALYREGRIEEAAAAFEKLRAESPGDDDLKTWHALAQLEKARLMKEAGAKDYKVVVDSAWAVLKPIRGRNADNPTWYLAVAKALWLNDRSRKAQKSIEKALYYQADFPEGLLLLGDIALGEGRNAPESSFNNPGASSKGDYAKEARRAYGAALESKVATADLRAEAHYKLGLTAMELAGDRKAASSSWQEAVKADPGSRCGKLAAEKLAKDAGR
jgi:tetratricopeptide (TPR) repeat protein